MDKQSKILLAVIGVIAAVIAIVRVIELNSESLQTACKNVAGMAKALVSSSKFNKLGPLYVLAPAKTSVTDLIAPTQEIIKINPEGDAAPYLCYIYLIRQTNEAKFSLLTVLPLECKPEIAPTRWLVKSAGKTMTFAELEQLLKDAPIAKVDEILGKPQQKITGFCGRKFVKYIYGVTELDPPARDAVPDWRLALDLSETGVQCWGLVGAANFDLNKLDDKHFGNVAAKR